jgi:hypothetical protein
LTEIYLCNVCACQEILRRNGRGQVPEVRRAFVPDDAATQAESRARRELEQLCRAMFEACDVDGRGWVRPLDVRYMDWLIGEAGGRQPRTGDVYEEGEGGALVEDDADVGGRRGQSAGTVTERRLTAGQYVTAELQRLQGRNPWCVARSAASGSCLAFPDAPQHCARARARSCSLSLCVCVCRCCR